ncbi:MAG: hypothetical protein Q9162_001720 [Coniocarpon cinnabarinum]
MNYTCRGALACLAKRKDRMHHDARRHAQVDTHTVPAATHNVMGRFHMQLARKLCGRNQPSHALRSKNIAVNFRVWPLTEHWTNLWKFKETVRFVTNHHSKLVEALNAGTTKPKKGAQTGAMPAQPHLYSFPTTDALASSLRRYIIHAQNHALQHHTAFRVAVSGGSLPKTLAKALLAQGNQTPEDTVRFSSWDIFFADERVVPLEHADSNYKVLKEELLDKIPTDKLGKPTVHVIDTALLDDPQDLADEYEQKLVKIFAAKDSVKLPLFDLLLLGSGPDGHTCSLFPGHPLLRETTGWVLPIEDSPKPPPKRITLSLPVVHAATRIAFVSTGAGKKDIIKQIFDEDSGRELPCGLVNQSGDKVSWFCDAPATEGVSFPKKSSL